LARPRARAERMNARSLVRAAQMVPVHMSSGLEVCWVVDRIGRAEILDRHAPPTCTTV
jgi:hypothetical protein